MSHDTAFADACTASSIPVPKLFGVEVTSIQAATIANASYSAPYPSSVWSKTQASGLNYCDIQIAYTHPGQNDNVTITLYLPQTSEWNGRFAASGGGGWSAKAGHQSLIRALDGGFAVAETNGGAPSSTFFSSSSWALSSPGNPDLQRLNSWASNTLHEMAVIGKDVTESFFGRPPSYNYWIGTSGSGRQGYMMAQRYPEDFDGIAAIAPAVNWAQVFPTLAWPTQIMHELGYAPPKCEVAALVAAAVDHCDKDDGVVDGVISSPELCTFDATTMIGERFDCDGTSKTFSADVAKIMQHAWTGLQTAYGNPTWYGYAKDTPLASGPFLNVLSTSCTEADECTPVGMPLSDDWFRYWLAADPDFDLSNMTRAKFLRLAHLGEQRYGSIIGTRDPDITAFRDAGGKMITWHGMTDNLIPYGGSVDYHDRVRQVDASVDDYFRLFLAPGTGHGWPGNGPFPYAVLDDLINWVEKGIAPDQLVAHDITRIDPATGKLKGSEAENAERGRPLCLHPRVQTYVSGDPDMLSSFRCVMPESAVSASDGKQARFGTGSMSIGSLFGY